MGYSAQKSSRSGYPQSSQQPKGSGFLRGRYRDGRSWRISSRDQFKKALQHGNHVKGRGRRESALDKLVPFTSRVARRTTMHLGTNRPFATAGAEVYAIYREKRAKGLAVSALFIRTRKGYAGPTTSSGSSASFERGRCRALDGEKAPRR